MICLKHSQNVKKNIYKRQKQRMHLEKYDPYQVQKKYRAFPNDIIILNIMWNSSKGTLHLTIFIHISLVV